MGLQRLMVWLLIGVRVGYILAQGTTPVAPAATTPVAPVVTTPTTVAPAATTPTTVAPVVTTPTTVAPAATTPTTVAPVVTTPTTVAPVVTTPTTPTTTKRTTVATTMTRKAYNWTLAVIPTGPRVTPSTDGSLTYKGKMCIAGVNCTTVEIQGARNELATFAGAILGGSFLLGLMLCGFIIFVGLRNEAKLEAKRAAEQRKFSKSCNDCGTCENCLEQKKLSADTTEKKDTDVKLEEVVVEVPAVKEVKETIVEVPPVVQPSPAEVKPDEEPKQVPAVSEPEEKDNVPAVEPEPIPVPEETPEPVRKPEPEIQSQQNFGLKSDPDLYPSASMRTASEDPENL